MRQNGRRGRNMLRPCEIGSRKRSSTFLSKSEDEAQDVILCHISQEPPLWTGFIPTEDYSAAARWLRCCCRPARSDSSTPLSPPAPPKRFGRWPLPAIQSSRVASSPTRV